MAIATFEELPFENQQPRILSALFGAALLRNAAFNPRNFENTTRADGNRLVTETEHGEIAEATAERSPLRATEGDKIQRPHFP
jgi:hypothetical protein